MITQIKSAGKKKFKFDVELSIEKLKNVSLPKGVFFCKAKLTDGGSFVKYTSRESVVSNCVTWPETDSFKFSCKLCAPSTTGVLETRMCRISVRKEVKGGKSHDKVGYVDVNLAEYAGASSVTRHYILAGYHDDKNRLDNCILKVSVLMTLTSGDTVFKSRVKNIDWPMVSGENDTPNRKRRNTTVDEAGRVDKVLVDNLVSEENLKLQRCNTGDQFNAIRERVVIDPDLFTGLMDVLKNDECLTPSGTRHTYESGVRPKDVALKRKVATI